MSAELRYSVSMTAKRLSVMVTLSQEEKLDPSKQGSWATINGRLIRYKVKVKLKNLLRIFTNHV